MTLALTRCFLFFVRTFEDPRDAEEAQYRMDRQRLFGREIEVEFARGDRKSMYHINNNNK